MPTGATYIAQLFTSDALQSVCSSRLPAEISCTCFNCSLPPRSTAGRWEPQPLKQPRSDDQRHSASCMWLATDHLAAVSARRCHCQFATCRQKERNEGVNPSCSLHQYACIAACISMPKSTCVSCMCPFILYASQILHTISIGRRQRVV